MSNDTTTAAANTVTPVAVVKAPSKMDLARPIFIEVTAVDYELPEGKTARHTFIARSQEEAGLTPKGAATYWQNLTKEAKGEPLYGKKGEAKVRTPKVKLPPMVQPTFAEPSEMIEDPLVEDDM